MELGLVLKTSNIDVSIRLYPFYPLKSVFNFSVHSCTSLYFPVSMNPFIYCLRHSQIADR